MNYFKLRETPRKKEDYLMIAQGTSNCFTAIKKSNSLEYSDNNLLRRILRNYAHIF